MNRLPRRPLALVAAAAFLAVAGTPVASIAQSDDCPAWNSDDLSLRETFWSYVPPDFVSACLEAGADLHARDYAYGATPLHWAAAFSGNAAVVAVLLDAGADPTLRNDDGYTPLDVAIREGRPTEIIAALRDGMVAEGVSPSFSCDEWISEDREVRWTFYQSLTPEIVLACLDSGADPHARREDGGTPLHSAAVFSQNPAVLMALLDAGADVNARGSAGLTPLHAAAGWNESPAVLAVLLDAGADPALKSTPGDTPLDLAIRFERPAEIIAALREALAARAASAPSPSIDCAGWNADDRDLRWDFYWDLTPELAQACLDAGEYHNARNEVGSTPLHWWRGSTRNPAVLAVLLNAGADVDVHVSEYDRTPLHEAALGNNNAAVIAMLLDAGADLTATNKYGGTPSTRRH